MLSYHMHVTKDITEKMIHNTYCIMKQKQKKKKQANDFNSSYALKQGH